MKKRVEFQKRHSRQTKLFIEEKIIDMSSYINDSISHTTEFKNN